MERKNLTRNLQVAQYLPTWQVHSICMHRGKMRVFPPLPPYPSAPTSSRVVADKWSKSHVAKFPSFYVDDKENAIRTPKMAQLAKSVAKCAVTPELTQLGSWVFFSTHSGKPPLSCASFHNFPHGDEREKNGKVSERKKPEPVF